jgi:hypothetical protein
VIEQARVIRWENPPPAGRGDQRGRRPTDQYDRIVAALQARPGRWAVITESVKDRPGLANHIRSGAIAAFAPRGDFDAVQRRVNGVYRVYACYYGDGEAL